MGKVASGETSADVSVRSRLADVPRQAAKRRCLIEILSRPEPLWDPSRHPDLDIEGGAAAWVKKLRDEAEQASDKRVRGENGE